MNCLVCILYPDKAVKKKLATLTIYPINSAKSNSTSIQHSKMNAMKGTIFDVIGGSPN